MHIHVRSLQKKLKQRKLKDGEYNEQHKKGNEQTVVQRTMYQKKTKDVATQTQTPLKTRDDYLLLLIRPLIFV